MTKQDFLDDFNYAFSELNKDLDKYAAFFVELAKEPDPEKREELAKRYPGIDYEKALALTLIGSLFSLKKDKQMPKGAVCLINIKGNPF